jgi:putative sterol carrier protein
MAVTPIESASAHWTSIRGMATGLAGISGCMELHVADVSAGLMLIAESGEVCIAEDGEAVALIATDSHETLIDLLSGDLPPIVAHLQGRLRFEGDAALALRVLFGLQESSPWAVLQAGRPS